MMQVGLLKYFYPCLELLLLVTLHQELSSLKAPFKVSISLYWLIQVALTPSSVVLWLLTHLGAP
jgi:hypothetical protein